MAVIAMYAEQVERLRQALGRRRFKRTVKIDTVDSFEGREEDIVVISLVRSNERGRIGFLRVPNRLNVAISRAKRLVACIGDSATLRSGDESMYGVLVEASRSTGGWLSALELVSQPKPRRGEQRPSGQPGGAEGGEEGDPERAAKRRRRRRRGRRGGPVPVTAGTAEPGSETGAPVQPTLEGQPQEGAQRRRRRRRRRGRGRGAGLGQPAGQTGETTGPPPEQEATAAPAPAGDAPEA
jgi:hypothetical protein